MCGAYECDHDRKTRLGIRYMLLLTAQSQEEKGLLVVLLGGVYI